MLKDRLIRHASRYADQAFVVGFYLYYIVDDKGKLKMTFVDQLKFMAGFLLLGDDQGLAEDLQSFENEWIEVEVRRPLGWKVDLMSPSTLPIPNFLADCLDHQLCGEEASDWKSNQFYWHWNLK